MGETETWDEFSERVRDLETEETAPDLISPYLALPGLRGFWTMGQFNETGAAMDMLGRHLHLTYNGDPLYNYDNLAPYVALDGTGDWLSRADEASLDITGTETYVDAAVRGLAMGGWFRFDNALPPAGDEACMAKWNEATGNRSYRLARDPAGFIIGEISSTGLAPGVVTATGTISVGANEWIFGAMKFDPSTQIEVFTGTSVGLNRAITATAAASIFNSNAGFFIGANSAFADVMTGHASSCFLCAMYLSDGIIESLYDQTRGAFGV